MSTSDSPTPPSWVQAFTTGIPYARASGMVASDIAKGRASLTLPTRPTWTGAAMRQVMHTGCLSVLADTACGLAVAATLDVMEPFATLDLRMDYLRPAAAGHDVLCKAECHRLSRSIAFVRGEIYQPGNEDLIATVHAAFMRATAKTRRDPPSPASRPAIGPAAAGPAPNPLPEISTPALATGRSPYVDYLGVLRGTEADGSLVFKLPFQPDFIGNPLLPALHGGVLAGFAETAMFLHLVYTAEPDEDSPPRAIDFSIDYLRSARPVDTYARCTTVRQGSRVALVNTVLWQDDPSRPVATTRGHLLLSQMAAI